MPQILQLPNEILIKICELLDRKGLTSIGSTCFTLNALAFKVYFEAHGMRLSRTNAVKVTDTGISGNSSDIQALRYAVSELRQLQDIEAECIHSDLPKLLTWVWELQEAIGTVKELQHARLSLDISEHHLYMLVFKQRTLKISPPLWRSIFVTLFNLVLDKNPKSFDIFTGLNMTEMGVLTLPAGPQTATLKGWLARVASHIRSLASPKAKTRPKGQTDRRYITPEGSLTATRSNRLTDLTIKSDMLLSDPFVDWTISVLQCNSQSITTLALSTTFLAHSHWNSFLPYVYLPHLSKFRMEPAIFLFDPDPGPTAEPPNATSSTFLARHKAIKKLSLHEPFWSWGLPVKHRDPHAAFPELHSLVATSRLVVFLLQNSDPEQLVQLKNVVCLDKSVIGSCKALEAIAHHRSIRNLTFIYSKGSSWDRELAADIPLPATDVLGHIKSLTIKLHRSLVDIDTDILIRLIHILPNVTKFHLIRSPSPGEANAGQILSDEDLRAVILKQCPQVQHVFMEYSKS